jgi:hypothetical protein
MNTVHAQLKIKRGKIADVEIPTDEEIEIIAMRMHKSGKPCLETILGWNVFYRPRENNSYTTTGFNVFTGERGEKSAKSKSVIPAEFTFGKNDPWSIVLRWGEGDDKPPAWFRYEDKLVRPPKQTHMENHDLCELVQDIPTGVKLHIWKPRANHRCAGGSHWHAKVKLSERPYYLELYWRKTADDPVQRVGIFRLNLFGLLRDRYIRPESKGSQSLDARLRFFRSDNGNIYVQTKQGKPQLPLPKEIQIDHLNSAVDDIPFAPIGSVVPIRTPTTGSRYQRDDKVRQFIIEQAKGVCEYCGKLDFLLLDGNHYLEAHHIIALAKQGPDTVDNVIALCPSDHREAHYGARAGKLEAEMIEIIKKRTPTKSVFHL